MRNCNNSWSYVKTYINSIKKGLAIALVFRETDYSKSTEGN